jgi:hypothetical protein
MLGRLIDRGRQRFGQHQDFLLLALLFTAFRFLTLLLSEPGGYILDWSGYYVPGASFVQLSDWGYYPIVHYWMEYPPLFPWLSVLVYRLSLFLPLWRDPELWFNLLLGSALLLFEIGNLVLVYGIALTLRGRQGAIRCAWLYALLFFPLMTLLFWFENFALFFLLLGVYMIIAKRPAWAGLSAGVGFMVKLVPAFIGPVALRVFPRVPQKIIYMAVGLVVALLIALPFLLNNPTFFLTPFLYQGSTGPWETIWALLDGYYTGGETTPLEIRFDPTNIAVSFHESTFPYWIVALAFMAIYLGLYTRRIDWQDNLKAVSFCGLSISLFLIFSKGYSPQWIINLLPFIVLLMPDLRGVAYSILLMGANVLEFPVALVLLAQHQWVFIFAVVLRTVVLVLVSVEFGLILFPSRRVKKSLGLALLALVLLLFSLSVPLGVQAARDYSASMLAENAYRDTIDYLASQPAGGVIFTDQNLYRQVFSFLATRHGLYLVEANDRLPDALSALAARYPHLYVLYAGSEDDQDSNPAVESHLSELSFPVSVRWLGNARLSTYSTSSASLAAKPVGASFAGGIELTQCELPGEPLRPDETLPLSLTWRALDVPSKDYTVFVHFMDQNGQVWAQHDGQPVGGWRPTSSWQPGEEIIDHHGLYLPPDLPPGEYRLAVGLYYASTNERLSVKVPGEAQPSDAVWLAPVTVSLTGS